VFFFNNHAWLLHHQVLVVSLFRLHSMVLIFFHYKKDDDKVMKAFLKKVKKLEIQVIDLIKFNKFI